MTLYLLYIFFWQFVKNDYGVLLITKILFYLCHYIKILIDCLSFKLYEEVGV